ncbi:MAG: DUF6236 family protein [Actinomycetota bacterium]
MEKEALYFPYIRVPQDAWFQRVLLYWDTVGTIVPFDAPLLLGEHTTELVHAGLVRPVHPGEYINDIGGFQDRFFALIDGEEAIQRRRGSVLDQEDVKQIHVDKMGDMICEGLASRGLGRPAENGEREYWWDLESRTADVFMAYLAAELGALEELNMDPVTDEANLFVPEPDTPISRAEQLRLGVLEAVLPAPQEVVPISELAAFKEKHGGRLAAFRTRIEEELLQIALIEDEETRLRQKSLTEARLRSEVEEISAEMTERRWPKVIFGTVCGLVGVGTAAGAAVVTGGAGIALAAPGLIGAAYAAVEGFPARKVPSSPLAYAALARTNLTG